MIINLPHAEDLFFGDELNIFSSKKESDIQENFFYNESYNFFI